MTGTDRTTTRPALDEERADLLEALSTHRALLRQTLDGLDDARAARRTTASALCLGGIVKHVTLVEDQWARFVVDGPSALEDEGAQAQQEWADGFRMLPGDTVEGLLGRYARAAGRTAALLHDLPDLGASQPLPSAPWFAPGARRSARRVLVHLVAETAQHAGHADIIRESLDGARTMG